MQIRERKEEKKMQIKINNKNYTVPQLTFKHFTKMEEQGLSIGDVFSKRQTMLAAMGFVCVVAECDRDEAERLIEQHVLGGGDLEPIAHAFFNAVMDSDFFCKMMGIEKPAKVKKSKAKAKVKTLEEEMEE